MRVVLIYWLELFDTNRTFTYGDIGYWLEAQQAVKGGRSRFRPQIPALRSQPITEREIMWQSNIYEFQRQRVSDLQYCVGWYLPWNADVLSPLPYVAAPWVPWMKQ